jgi:hypothetical protein
VSKVLKGARVAKTIAVFIVAASAQGCLNTSYHDMRQKEAPPQIAERRVSFWLNKKVFNQLYPCVFVIPAKTPAPGLTLTAERSFERHLYEKFGKVITRKSVVRISKRKLIDIDNDEGVAGFAKKMRCPLSASIELKELKNEFLMFYARKSLKIEVRLKDARTGDLLWHATHSAGRGDGALPLSPISAISSVVRATRLSGDREQFESIVDDAVRRIARTLPSFKFESG